MDKEFNLEIFRESRQGLTVIVPNYFQKELKELQERGKDYIGKLNSSPEEKFFYLTMDKGYSYGNLSGRWFQDVVWPEFFSLYPKGRIFILSFQADWLYKTWGTQKKLAKDDLKGFYFKDGVPHELAGVSITSFPWIAMRFLSFGVYPLVLGSFTVPYEQFFGFFYIPDQTLHHSQVLNSTYPYRNILEILFDYFNDQWTFDGSRGPKQQFPPTNYNFLESLDYIRWFCTQIKNRMEELCNIADEFVQFKIGSTLNRAIVDAICSMTSEVPYFSLIFFFNCLEKLANIMKLLGKAQNEAIAWKLLVSPQFIGSNLRSQIKTIPGNIGQFMIEVIDLVLEELTIGEVTPELLRAIRNSHHGYDLKRVNFELLMGHNGEINNNIPLLVCPLINYFLSNSLV